MIVPLLSSGKTVSRMTCAIDVRIPFPDAWRILPTIITGKEGASTQISSPAINNPIAVTYSLFVGNRVMRKAVSGIMIPMAREYPLVSHCPVAMVRPKSSMIGGSAVVRAVASMEDAIQVIIILINISIFCLFVIIFSPLMVLSDLKEQPIQCFFFLFTQRFKNKAVKTALAGTAVFCRHHSTSCQGNQYASPVLG